MKFYHPFYLPFLLFVLAACGQSKQLADSQPKSDEPLADALLWKVSSDNIQDSYVFGTIHLIPSRDYFLPAGTDEAMEQSDLVVFEIDMNEMTDLGTQMALFTKAFMSNGTTLEDLLSEEDYDVVSDHFNQMGLPLFMLDRIKPMFLSIFATGDFSLDDLSGDGTTSYEMEFFAKAESAGKNVAGLETMEFQLAMFDSIPYKAQAEMLVDAIKYNDEDNSQFQKLVEVYKSQDISTLYDLVAVSDQGMGDYEEMLIANRNKNWISTMSEMMTNQPCFFAVGAGHLAGEAGVIRLLMKAGYDVAPVTSAPAATEGRTKKKF